jgi:phosphatidylglycerol:prolipoprotein diacylglycerol transferase
MIEGIQIGSYMLRFYGILIVLGAIAATWLAGRLIRRKAADTIGKGESEVVEVKAAAAAIAVSAESSVETTSVDEAEVVVAESDQEEAADDEEDEDENEDEDYEEEDQALTKEANRLTEMAWDIMPWALLGGVLGARIWHIILPPASMVNQGITTMFYLTHPIDAISIWKGGLGIPGAVIGGFIAVWLYCRSKQIPVGFWADAIAPGLALAQAIGRWGNLFNQELYGAPTDLPWKLFIAPNYRLPQFQDVAYYHPLFLYESLWNLANVGLLLWLGRRYAQALKTWDIFYVYMVFYGVGRFLLEYLRLDPAPFSTLNANQAFMGVVVVAGVIGLIFNHRKIA